MNVKKIFDSALPLIEHGAWEEDGCAAVVDAGWEVKVLYCDLLRGSQRVFAVDPGYAALGACLVHPNGVMLWQARNTLPKPGAVAIVRRSVAIIDWLADPNDFDTSVMENASFGSPFGQANLGLARGAILSRLQTVTGDQTYVYPPQKIKKLVHGTTKVDYHKLSKKYPDATAALAIALAHIKETENV